MSMVDGGALVGKALANEGVETYHADFLRDAQCRD
jgi:hypothetical protein